ncbi:hypothetical protein [Frankia tisae]|uniref:hypothetical protein n=1 Tax=Frankia tisae TaxID=2950104 RepID=UPI0021C1395D|nr:hypothetical protein [Frankia tisae]
MEILDLLQEAYTAWADFFASTEKLLYPGNVDVPCGYVPMCLPAGCEMKESYYLRSENAPPVRVADSARRLVDQLSAVAVAAAAEIALAAGRPLVRRPFTGCLRSMRYPAFVGEKESDLMCALETRGAVRATAHTDLNALTVLTPRHRSGSRDSDGR